MIPKAGLYYPFIHFQSDEWLKTAALYWPKIARIVPPGFDLSDSDVVRALAAELGFVVNVSPGPAAGDLTTILTETLRVHLEELKERYKVSEKAAFVITNDMRGGPRWPRSHARAYGWALADPALRHTAIYGSRRNLLYPEPKAAAEVVGLHSSKGEDRLWQLLEYSGLAVRQDAWWGLHPELAWLYSCALADRLAAENRLVPMTDLENAHIESLGWTDESFVAALLGHSPASAPATDDDWSVKVGQLAIRMVVPADLNDVPVSKIIKIRQRYGSDFDAFHNEVAAAAEDIGSQLAIISDPGVLEAYLDNVIQARFRRPVRSLQKAMRSVGIDSAYAALTTKFELPAGAALFGGILAGNSVATYSGALAFGAATLLRGYSQSRNRQLEPSAASYLWRLERDISPQSLLARLLRQHKLSQRLFYTENGMRVWNPPE